MASAQGTAFLYGSVADTLGQPIRASVRVVGSDLTSIANGLGRYRLAVPAGRVIVRVAHIGVQPAVDTLTMAAGDSLERDYRLAASAGGPETVLVNAAEPFQPPGQGVTSVRLGRD